MSVSPPDGAPQPALRVLVVDDEALARARVVQLVRQSGAEGGPAAVVLADFATAADTFDWLTRHDADVLLLDIHMPGLDGIALAARLKALPRPPAVVFVTAHAEHALQAFELDAADYLTKPVRRDRLHAALQRVQRRLPAADAPAEAVIVVSERGRLVRVPLLAVLYLKAELKYVTLRTALHTYVLDDALSDLEQRLGERFLRVHRNAIVAKAAVQKLERRGSLQDGADGWEICVQPTGEWLSVSRRQVPTVREMLRREGV